MVESKKRKLDELSKSISNGVNPEHKDEYQNVGVEFQNSNKAVGEFEQELQKFQGEEQDIDIDWDENDEEKSMFVPADEQSSSSNKPNRAP